MFDKITPPEGGKITVKDGKLVVPDNPIIPYIVGDGVGPDITAAMRNVVNAAVEKAYGGKRRIVWFRLFAGQDGYEKYGEYLPDDTVNAIREYIVAIKGPLTTPVGGGYRSLNVAMRQRMELFACVRPVRHFKGVPAPVKYPEKLDVVIFRENTEDVYAGIEWAVGSDEVEKVRNFLTTEMGKSIRPDSGIGIKPISITGSKRLVRAAINYAIKYHRRSVTLVHKGNIMKFTEGAFKTWGYELAKQEFGAQEIDGGPWCSFKNPKTGKDIVVKDVIADAFLQQILLRPAEYSVIATLNLNGDYISDALAAQVGGIGMAPGANLSDDVALFEATHGTAPKYAGKDQVNPGSLILSAEMMLRHMDWNEAADLIVTGLSGAIDAKTVTYDLDRLMEGSTKLSCSAFGQAIVKHMQ